MEFLGQGIKEVWFTAKPLVEASFKSRPEVQEFDGREPTIVAVHGIFGSWPKDGIKDYLAKRHQHTYLLDWGAQTGHFDHYLERLKSFIRDNKIEHPILLGTSVGGLLALVYGLDEGFENVRKIITISTPYQGVRIPKIVNIYPGVKETNPGTEIIKRVNSVNYPTGLIHASAGAYDQFVHNEGSPPKGIALLTLPYWGHAVNQHANPELISWLDNILDHELI